MFSQNLIRIRVSVSAKSIHSEERKTDVILDQQVVHCDNDWINMCISERVGPVGSTFIFTVFFQ